jgi:hypothetical protein
MCVECASASTEKQRSLTINQTIRVGTCRDSRNKDYRNKLLVNSKERMNNVHVSSKVLNSTLTEFALALSRVKREKKKKYENKKSIELN